MGSLAPPFIRKVSFESRLIGARVRAWRVSRGVRQAELAERLRWSVARLSAIENGLREVFLPDVEELGAELGKPVSWFERECSL